MKKKFKALTKQLMEHVHKHWKYEEDKWKKAQEENERMRQQVQIQNQKQYLYDRTLQLQQELYNIYSPHHLSYVKALTNPNQLMIHKIDPRTPNLHYFTLQLADTRFDDAEANTLRQTMNKMIENFTTQLKYNYQNDIENAYITYPFTTHGIWVASVQKMGTQLLVTFKTNLPL